MTRREQNFESYLDDEDAHDVHHRAKRRRRTLGLMSAVASIAATIASIPGRISNYHGRLPGASTVKRKRLDVDSYVKTIPDRCFCRRHRMDKESFYNLVDILSPHLPSTGEQRSTPGSVPNGPITHSARVSMALRIAAGGDPLDIASFYGVNDYEPMNSFWDIVDAINQAEQLNIEFPRCHEEQEKIAEGFRRKSEIDIDCCVGAIDGVLIWIHKPTDADCGSMGFGPVKFFCGRKKKFGLNMQAVCDANRRFLWIEIRYPASTSDFFAFQQSSLKEQLEAADFLRKGLCLFGDAAYVTTPYMCSPYRSATGEKDDFNFFQSQLRINIECAFGMLVHRFGILRGPFPKGATIEKTSAAVLALCKLHNYCIADSIDAMEAKDTKKIMLDGGMLLPRIDGRDADKWVYDSAHDRLDDLLDGGEHCDDHTYDDRRKYRHEIDLPNERILEHIVAEGHRRPDRRS